MRNGEILFDSLVPLRAELGLPEDHPLLLDETLNGVKLTTKRLEALGSMVSIGVREIFCQGGQYATLPAKF